MLDDAEWLRPGNSRAHFRQRELGDVRRARIDFHVRKFPKLRVDANCGPLAHQETATMLEHESDESPGCGGRSLAEVGQAPDGILPVRDTMRTHRAGPALRLPRCANERAQFHERLVQRRAIPTTSSMR